MQNLHPRFESGRRLFKSISSSERLQPLFSSARRSIHRRALKPVSTSGTDRERTETSPQPTQCVTRLSPQLHRATAPSFRSRRRARDQTRDDRITGTGCGLGATIAWSAPSREIRWCGNRRRPARAGARLHVPSPRPVRRKSQRERLTGMNDVTRILSAIEQGDPEAAEQLVPLVYEELRKLAAQRLANEKPGQTFQATALVHEAYVRLVDVENAQHWNSRGHFFGAAAEAMRRILVERARHKRSLKAGGDRHRRDLSDVDLAPSSRISICWP